jgi:transcriptional regulator with XRE-family HTH domain
MLEVQVDEAPTNHDIHPSVAIPSGDGSMALTEPDASAHALPAIGAVIRRLRRQRGWSIRDVADAANISPSFLGAVERGASDISVGRLAAVAHVFGHDVASLLGYSARQSRPRLIRPDERVRLFRGKGIDFTALRIPGTTLEMMVATLEPLAAFNDVVSHAGTDILFVAEGQLVLVVDGIDYPLSEGDCAVWPSSHAHTVRNDSDRPARAIGLATETVY